MYINNTGYPTSELISRIFTECDLVYNFNPRNLSSETEDEKLKTFFSIGSFNNILFMIKNGFLKKEIIIAELKFPDNFKRAIENPTEKNKKAADFYPDWFKMCCHLKYLLKDEGLKYFKHFLSLSEKYNEKECEKFYENCEPKWGSIPGVFSLIDKFIPPEPQLDRKQVIKKSFFPNQEN